MARVTSSGCATLMLLLAAALGPIPSRAADRMAVAVADFDYQDTSGEVGDQAAAHAARVRAFAQSVRDELGAQAAYRIVSLGCGKPACSATSLGADGLIGAARQAGARLLVYGGIHKMSTLVQWGDLQIVDLERGTLLLNRMFTFRGDTDEAFRRAADFIGGNLAGLATLPTAPQPAPPKP